MCIFLSFTSVLSTNVESPKLVSWFNINKSNWFSCVLCCVMLAHHRLNEWSLFRFLLIIIYDSLCFGLSHCCVKLCAIDIYIYSRRVHSIGIMWEGENFSFNPNWYQSNALLKRLAFHLMELSNILIYKWINGCIDFSALCIIIHQPLILVKVP